MKKRHPSPPGFFADGRDGNFPDQETRETRSAVLDLLGEALAGSAIDPATLARDRTRGGGWRRIPFWREILILLFMTVATWVLVSDAWALKECRRYLLEFNLDYHPNTLPIEPLEEHEVAARVFACSPSSSEWSYPLSLHAPRTSFARRWCCVACRGSCSSPRSCSPP